jgi:membrane protease YdiL (CAAX protease family)
MTKGPALRSRRWTLAGVGVAIGGPPALAAVSPAVTGGTANLVLQVVLHLVFVAVAALVLFIMLRHERLSLSSVGLRRPDWSTLLTAGLLLVSALLLQALVIDPLAALWGQEGVDDGIRQLVALPLWFRFVVGVTSGVVEEFLYRGYAIERLGALTGRRGVGAGLATMGFALAHVPAWGLGFALIADLPFGILMAAFYLWRRDLVANMLAHSAGLVLAMFTVGSPTA